MKIYESAIQLMLEHVQTKEWPDLKLACERALSHTPVAWHFPIRGCQAVGGSPKDAVPAVAAITCAHMAIMLIDDMLDEDPRGVFHTYGHGRTANLAFGLIGLGSDIILSSACPKKESAAQSLFQMVLRTAYGQSLDIQNVHSEESYWNVARTKSSPYFRTALFIGAIFGGGTKEQAEQLGLFGDIYGEIMQIHDDLNDCLATPANVDWVQGRSPLPILFAELVAHPERERFMELRAKVDDPSMLEEAQAILVRCGAISYCVSELMLRCEKGQALLDEMSLADSEPIRELLDEAIAPVKHLFEKVGAPISASG